MFYHSTPHILFISTHIKYADVKKLKTKY